MRTCCSNGIDADTRIMEALDAEAWALVQIDQDETSQKLRDLPRPQLPVSYLGPYKDRLY